MAKHDPTTSELVRAAQALEDELSSLEALSDIAQRTRLDSEKNISRATKELGEALEMPERLAARLGALSAAMQRMQARQKAALEPLSARADSILERKQRLALHVHAYATLGKATEDATGLLQSDAEPSQLVEQLKAKLATIAEDARSLFEAARTDDFPDVARESDALYKRVTALRRRLDGEHG